MVQAATGTTETNVDPKIKAIFDDTTSTMRFPSVPLVFRALAPYPDYLQMAWQSLKPNVQIVYFEESADELRTFAVQQVAGWGNVPSLSGNTDAVKLAHYTAPKIFLAVAALRSATNGLEPRLMELPQSAKAQIATGLPELRSEPPGAAPPDLENDVTTTLGAAAADALGGLLAAGDSGHQIWNAWKPQIQAANFRQFSRALRHIADDTITALPFRMGIYPHALRHAGMSEQTIDAIRAVLQEQYMSLIAAVGMAAFAATGTLGRETAQQSPFPASVL